MAIGIFWYIPAMAWWWQCLCGERYATKWAKWWRWERHCWRCLMARAGGWEMRCRLYGPLLCRRVMCYLRCCARAAVLRWWKSSARIKLILSYKMYYLLLSYIFFGTLKHECKQLKYLSSRRRFRAEGEKVRILVLGFFLVEQVFHVKKSSRHIWAQPKALLDKGLWSMEMVWRLPWAFFPFGLFVVMISITPNLVGLEMVSVI